MRCLSDLKSQMFSFVWNSTKMGIRRNGRKQEIRHFYLSDVEIFSFCLTFSLVCFGFFLNRVCQGFGQAKLGYGGLGLCRLGKVPRGYEEMGPYEGQKWAKRLNMKSRKRKRGPTKYKMKTIDPLKFFAPPKIKKCLGPTRTLIRLWV